MEPTKLTNDQITAVTYELMSYARFNPELKKDFRLIFQELDRARAAEEAAIAKAERWQERYEAQCETTVAAQDRVEMLNAVSLRKTMQILRWQKLVNEAIDLGEEINENS